MENYLQQIGFTGPIDPGLTPYIDRNAHLNLTEQGYLAWLQGFLGAIGTGVSPEEAGGYGDNNVASYEDTSGQSAYVTQTAPPPTSPTGGGTTYTPNYVYIGGTRYDLNNPQQADAYYGTMRDQYISQAENQSRSALEEASRGYSQNLGSLNQDIENLGRSKEQYGRGAARNITELGEGYNLGTVKRGAFFGQRAPRAYESSQGSSQLYARGKLQQGIGDVTSALEEANINFGQQEQGLQQERGNLEYGYNRFTQGQQDYLNQARQAASDYYNTQGANAFNIDSPGAFSYSRNSFTPYQARQVDLSGVTPFTTFSKLPGAQQPNTQPAGQYQAQYQPQSGYQGLEQYLGYQPDEQERTLLDRYLRLGY